MTNVFRKTPVFGQILLLLILFSPLLASAAVEMDGEILYIIRRYQQLPALIASGKNAEAAAVIEQVIPVFESNKAKDRAYVTGLEFCYYARGLVALQAGDYPKATKHLQDYLRRYGGSERAHLAKIMLADCFASQKKWKETITVCRDVEGDPKLRIRERLAIRQLLAEALFTLKRWRESIPPLLYVYQNAPDWSVHVDSAVSLTVCLIRLEEFAKLYKWIPLVYDTPARFDIDLNIALIEEGDRQYTGTHFQEALLLYRLVFSKTELISQIQERIVEARRQAARPARGRNVEERRAAEAVKSRHRRAVGRFEGQLKVLKEFPEYDSKIAVRTATCYFDLKRYPNALQMYRSIAEDFKGTPEADRALFSAYSTALMMKDREVAIAEAAQYIEKHPDGDFFDDLTISLVQLHMEDEEFGRAIEVAQRALEINPDHGMKAQLVYFMGYNLFQLEMLPEAIAHFERVLNEFGDTGFEQVATYWTAMAYLFLADYPAAEAKFIAFLDEFGTGPYAQDALYRLGVAQYGAGDYGGATATFGRHLRAFPGSPQSPDIYGMLGDIYAADALLDEAIHSYNKMSAEADSIVQVNYSYFQRARTYELEQKYDEIIEMFRGYLDEWGTQGNFTEAAYWIGTAQHKKGDVPASLDTFLDAIVTYGNDRKHYGIDAMIFDLMAEHENLVGRPEYDTFLKRLYEELEQARSQRKRTLGLRLRALFARTAGSESGRARMGESLLNEELIPLSGPITLVVMGEEARAHKKDALARSVYERFLADFRDSDLVMSALRGMAEIYSDAGDYDRSAELLNELVTRFPQMEDAGWAMTRLGDIYRIRGDFAGAEEQLTTVLQVKEWRGEAWAEALYNLGLINMDRYLAGKDKTQSQVDWAALQQEFPGIPTYREVLLEWVKKSHVYFERVYVMYSGYPKWGARSYLKATECLQVLGHKDKAVKTLEEMLSQPALSSGPEGEQAREMLKRLGGAS